MTAAHIDGRVYVALDDAARLAGVSTKTIRRRIKDGTLPAYRLGGLVKIAADDLHKLIAPIAPAGISS